MQFFFDILKYLVWKKVINSQTMPDSNRIKFMLRNNCKILFGAMGNPWALNPDMSEMLGV